MTDRHAGYLVTLAEDWREDDAEHVINALRMVRGVADVTPIVADYALHIAKVRANDAWRERIVKLLREAE
jgi:hypothetical protein